MIKKLFLSVLLIIFGWNVFAQLAPHKYLVRFTDKNNSPYSFSDSLQFLTSKALARRAKQGISLKYNDLPVSPAYIDSIINTGVTVICSSKWFNSVTIFTTDSVAFAKINSFPFVVSVDSVTRIKNKTPSVSNAGKFAPIQVKLTNKANIYVSNPSAGENLKIDNYDYGMATNQITMIGGDYLHNHGYRGQGMTIAIIDAGFNSADTLSAFDSLRNDNRILGTKDFVTPGANVFQQANHGMNVLSTIAADEPGAIIGTAPLASFWLLCSEDVTSENIIEEFNWASAAEFADSVGADVINSSLGYTTFDSPWMDHTYADMNGHTCPSSIAATIAASKGMIVCNSAGNSGEAPWHFIGAPADADSIITVGGVDQNGIYAAFSSKGPTSDGRIKPTVAAQGENTVVMSTAGTPTTGNGTSFSSPIITGATACLWQAFPTMNNMQIIQAIIESSSQYTHPDSLMGYGIPNYAAAFMLLEGLHINDIDKENAINIFPNPFTGLINIVFFSGDTGSINIDIFDITGKKVVSETSITKNTGYNYYAFGKASSLQKGIYIMRITTKNSTFTRKLVKGL